MFVIGKAITDHATANDDLPEMINQVIKLHPGIVGYRNYDNWEI